MFTPTCSCNQSLHGENRCRHEASRCTGYTKPIYLIENTVIQPFESLVVQTHTSTAFLAGRLQVSTSAMDSKQAKLPLALAVNNTYAILKRRSKTVHVILQNTTGSTISLKRGLRVAQVQTSNKVHKPQIKPGPLKYLDELEGNNPNCPSLRDRTSY